jgi:hypothetical protein
MLCVQLTQLASSKTISGRPILILSTYLCLGARGSVVLSHYAASRKVAGSRPDEMKEFFFQFT